MELKQVFFEKRTRISGSAQRLSNYTFAVLFALISPIMLIMSLTEGKFKMELFLMGIGVLLVLLGLAYLAYRAALKLKRVEADEEKIYIIHNKTDVEEVLYAQVTGGNRGWTLITREFYIKLFYLDKDDVQQKIKFTPRIMGDHYDNFVDLLSQKNPNLTIRRRRNY